MSGVLMRMTPLHHSVGPSGRIHTPLLYLGRVGQRVSPSAPKINKLSAGYSKTTSHWVSSSVFSAFPSDRQTLSVPVSVCPPLRPRNIRERNINRAK